MKSHLKKARQRLTSVNWKTSERESRYSDFVLLKEYLRRIALLAEVLGDNSIQPILNPVNLTSLEISKDMFDEVVSEVGIAGNAYVIAICKCYLMWNYLIDEKEVLAQQFPDIFDPLIKLFERGGRVALSRGEFVIGSCCLPLNNWRQRSNEPAKDITDSSLENIEREYSL
ncbi:MAG: hypothetical protein VSS75_023050 [Candidatus Parabeggiatoa sp.]|nr:hypothetical protein [Candidatus Parabeggiatoa sp.]